jgi:hypothetical protein
LARLVEVQGTRECPSSLVVRPGELLLFWAAGGHVRSGHDVVELLGAFVTATVGDNGEILEPMGPPNAVVMRAKAPGRALIDVVTGDPFHAPITRVFGVTVNR